MTYFNKKLLCTLLLFTLLLASSLMIAGCDNASTKHQDKIKNLPSFTLIQLNSRPIQSTAFQDRVTLVHFWSISCAICLQEMPQMIDLHHRFANDTFSFLGVVMSYDPPMNVLDYQARFQLPFILGMDSDKSVAKAFGNVQLTPTTLLYDREGKLIQSYVGAANFPELEKLITQALKK